MVTTGWATAEGFYDAGGGQRQPAKAELSHDGLAIVAVDGAPIARWKLTDLVRTMVPDGFQISVRGQVGGFVFDPSAGSHLVGALARIPDAGAPVMPRTLVWNMMVMVAVALAALFVLAQALFWIAERLFGAGSGLGPTG